MPNSAPPWVELVETLPEQSAQLGIDKNYYYYGSAKTYNQGTNIGASVTHGKTFYITQFSIASFAADETDADNNCFCIGYIYDSTDSKTLFVIAGNGGAGMNFSKPITVPSDHAYVFQVYTYANHACNIRVSANGYEL